MITVYVVIALAFVAGVATGAVTMYVKLHGQRDAALAEAEAAIQDRLAVHRVLDAEGFEIRHRPGQVPEWTFEPRGPGLGAKPCQWVRRG